MTNQPDTMLFHRTLRCTAPACPPALEVSSRRLGPPHRGQLLVDVVATSVNPIDVRRAAGYGRRVFGLRSGGRFPACLGNDVVGVVREVPVGDRNWSAGDRVFGVIDAGSGGAHADRVLADARWLRRVPDDMPDALLPPLAALPYTFSTAWRALRATGLGPRTSQRRRVLMLGAGGGLGRLALPLLASWGAQVTAVCSTPDVQDCLDLGATSVLDRLRCRLDEVPPVHDASLNFGDWSSETWMLDRLRRGAMGHATTVHPLLSALDEGGWICGGRTALDTFLTQRRRARERGVARYAWVVFRPDAQALDALAALVADRNVSLPIGLTTPLEQAADAFRHVAERRPGRALLLPQPC